MKLLRRAFLPLCLAMCCVLLTVQPAVAQRNKNRANNPGGLPPGGLNQGGMNQGNNPNDQFGNPNGNNQFGNNGNIQFGNPNTPAGAAAASAASGIGTGMIVGGIGMILVGLALTGGVIYLALAGQKTSYAGGTRRRRKKRRDDED